MRQLASLCFLCMSMFFFSAPCAAKTLYVNNVAGSDTNSGAIPENEGGNAGPLRTIETALRHTFRGDTVELADTGVPYAECITLQGSRNSGYEFAPFRINGNGATLDGSASVPANKWEFVRGDLYRFLPERGGYQMLLLDGEPAKELPRFDGSYVSSFLQPGEWCRCNGGIHFMAEKGKSPYSHDLRYAKHRVGITLYDVEHVVIEDLTVRGYQLDGINAHDNAMDCALYKVTAEANGRSGIAINGASRVKVVDCNARDNATVQLRCDNWSTTRVITSKLESEERPVWTRHVNVRGQGARLWVDGKRQYELQGYWTKQDAEQQRLGDSLDELEMQQGLGLDSEPVDDAPEQPIDVLGEAAEADEPVQERPDGNDVFADDVEPAADDADTPVEDEGGLDLFDDVEGDDGNFGDMEDEDDPFGDI